jgi:hypothetical protein
MYKSVLVSVAGFCFGQEILSLAIIALWCAYFGVKLLAVAPRM